MKRDQHILVHSPDTLQDANKRVSKAKGPKRRKIFKAEKADKNRYLAYLPRGTVKTTSPKSVRKVKAGLQPTVIGLWDLGAWIGGLTGLIEGLNRSQKAFQFFEVKALVPAGLISRPERMIAWLSEALGRKLKTAEREVIENNLIANDYFKLAETIRKDFGLDYLVGITPSMVAGFDESDVYWNHFSTSRRGLVLVSTYQLRDFAVRSRQPFEAFLATIIVAQLLVAKYYPKIGFHDNRGCLFDYNESRVSLIDIVRAPTIEADCLTAIPAAYRPAVQALVQYIDRLRKG